VVVVVVVVVVPMPCRALGGVVVMSTPRLGVGGGRRGAYACHPTESSGNCGARRAQGERLKAQERARETLVDARRLLGQLKQRHVHNRGTGHGVQEHFFFQELHKSWPVKQRKPWHKPPRRQADELAGIQQAALVRRTLVWCLTRGDEALTGWK